MISGQHNTAGLGVRLFALLTCIGLVVWTVSPNASHVPKIVETFQEHAEVIAEHGHSHGLEEDLLWAMHGHSHDVADHDHGQTVLIPTRYSAMPVETDTTKHAHPLFDWVPPVFRLERPPRV